jgi:Asp-tRNA(Asn)/Glu-tRNA(Gln) amidotransferase A subunit family amidase
MAFKEYGDYDAVGLAELVRRKQVSPRELLDEAIARTERLDPQLNAVVVRHDDFAYRQIERGLPEGPFAGVPFLLKDLEPAEYFPIVTAVSTLYAGHQPVQHVGSAGDVGATGVEQSRIADRHDVRWAIW